MGTYYQEAFPLFHAHRFWDKYWRNLAVAINCCISDHTSTVGPYYISFQPRTKTLATTGGGCSLYGIDGLAHLLCITIAITVVSRKSVHGWSTLHKSAKKGGVGALVSVSHLTTKEHPCHVYSDSMPSKQIIGQTITYNGTTCFSNSTQSSLQIRRSFGWVLIWV